MRKRLSVVFAIIAWFSVIAQVILMLQNRVSDIPETVIRFFSYFTILTNTLVALYFTAICFNLSIANRPGLLTAITSYIFIVGIVYQIVLRHLWQPAGIQLIVDELLHTINPVLVIIFWYLYEKKSGLRYGLVKIWLIFPWAYMACALIRGKISGFYPYPFINISTIGLTRTLINCAGLTLIYVIIASLFILIGRKIG
jgi:hypothetical protein